MSEPFIGEIRMFAGSFAPVGWAFCAGQLVAISENDALFSLIGTTYGGDGRSTFGLPDLRGRIPVHQGTGPGTPGFVMGETGGVEVVTLTVNEVPAHGHPLTVSVDVANQSSPSNNVVAQSTAADLYIEDAPTAGMAPASVSSVGGGQPHDNLQPYLCINYIISLFGIYPSPT